MAAAGRGVGSGWPQRWQDQAAMEASSDGSPWRQHGEAASRECGPPL